MAVNVLMCTREFFLFEYSSRSKKLITLLHVVPQLRMNGDVSILPYISMWCMVYFFLQTLVINCISTLTILLYQNSILQYTFIVWD
jgi:hypothetical protein